LFFCAVSVELMSLVLLCCQSTTSTLIQSITLPSQAERWQPLFRQPVRCAQHRILNTHIHRKHSCWPHTRTTYAHTHSNKHVHRLKYAHIHSAATVVDCCLLHAFLILSLSLIPSHPSSPAWPGMLCLTPTNVTSAICTTQGVTAVHDYFPFLHRKACVCCFLILPSIHTYENQAR